MGGGSFQSTSYNASVRSLAAKGQTYQRSAQAQQTGNYNDIAEVLDPSKLKNGIRESCVIDGCEDVLPVIVSLDNTGSMQDIPHYLQKELPKLIDLMVEQGVTSHPNVLFMGHDDELVVKNAAFQMSQFEIESDKLLGALNEMIIPQNGGGNDGEGYHLSIYAAARHTRLESFEKHGVKGFLFLIGDENPYYHNGDPSTLGTTREIAEAVFGDKNEGTVTMLESLKQAAEKYHIFLLRPQHTGNGTNENIGKNWKNLFQKAGINPENVIKVQETSEIVTTMCMIIGRIAGVEESEIVDVLRKKGTADDALANVARSTTALVPVGSGGPLATSKASKVVVTGAQSGRVRS